MSKKCGLFFVLALSALLGFTPSEARAELISMTITTSSTTIDVDIFAVQTGTTYTVDAAGIDTINGLLFAAGSCYQFITLGGSSNFPGDATQGQLTITGEIHAVSTAGTDTVLSIEETEDNFTSPTGAAGLLSSSSTGLFTNQPAGGGHTASSSFNTTDTATYSVLSTTTLPNPQGGSASAVVSPVSTLYELDNKINFSLLCPPAGANDVVDQFGVVGTIMPTAVPEPASMVLMLTSMPLPLVVLGLLRRRRRLVA